MKLIKKWSINVRRFTDSKRLSQVRYRGTWRWDAGYVDNLVPSFPIFSVEESSHGYKRLKSGSGFSGPVIKTKAEAVRQATAAMLKAKENDK